MKKLEYVVLKPFSIIKDASKMRIAKTEKEEKSGSTFTTQTAYHDYESKGGDIQQAPITLHLIEQGYIELKTPENTF